jgi:hypothetical protein
MERMHDKCYEFSMHKKGDIDLQLFSFSKICRLNKHELRITSYMKDVLYEAVPTKFVSSFLKLYFIFYEFSILRNELVQKVRKS